MKSPIQKKTHGLLPVAMIAGIFMLMTGTDLLAQNDPDLLIYEGFDYDAGGSIELLNGGIGWSTSWQWRQNFTGKGSVVLNSAIVESGNLDYGDLVVSGNHVHLTGENGSLELGRGFSEVIGGEPGTRTYISYLGQRVGPVADPGSAAYGGNYPWGSNLYPRGASLRFWDSGERVSIGNYSNQDVNKWGVYGSGLPLTHSEVSFSDEVAFVVVRIDHQGGGQGDSIYFWVNPDLSQPEDTGTADFQLLDISDDGAPVNIGPLQWVSPFAGNASLDSQARILRPHAEFLMDEIRVGRTYASVTPMIRHWADFEMTSGAYADTGHFLQWIYPTPDGWNWSYALETWHFLPAEMVIDYGAWVYVKNFSGLQPVGGSGAGFWEGYSVDANGVVETGQFLQFLNVLDAPWVWSYSLNTWIYVAPGSLQDGDGYVFIFNTNTGESSLPGKALLPVPADGVQTVEAAEQVITLQWNPGQRATSHNVYLGTDAEAVAEATPESGEFLGTVTGSSLEVTEDFYSLDKYYWRVDAINETGVSAGDIWWFRPAQLAFPGAQGHGRYALGGRHGRIIHVTNLDDSGPGSLRAAIEDETGPRIVVFDVGGLITLESDLAISDADKELTIAGQTAPSPGITIRNQKMGVSGGDHVVIRFLRLKLGDISGETSDGTGMQGSMDSIMDHLTVSWSIDEVFSSRSAKNITLQRTILSEALNAADHQNYPSGSEHGFAASVGGDVGSFHHNLLAHCAGRNWSMAGGLDRSGAYAGRLDFTNNVVYNWRHRTTDGGAREVNFVGNYYKGGPASERDVFLNPQHEKAGTGSQRYFVEGNILDMVAISGINDRDKQVGPDSQVGGYTTNPEFPDAYVDDPFFENYVETQPAREAYKHVLSDVGCNIPVVDNHDNRIVGEVLSREFTYRGSRTNLPGLIDSQDDLEDPWAFYMTSSKRRSDFDTDRDGLPNWYEALVGTNPNSPQGDDSDMRSDPDRDGFTLMDDYLAWLAAPHVECAQDGSVEVDMAGLTRGFTNVPVFSIDSAVNGSVQVIDSSKAVFSPSAWFIGLGSFSFTVTDAEGDSMSRTVGIHIK